MIKSFLFNFNNNIEKQIRCIIKLNIDKYCKQHIYKYSKMTAKEKTKLASEEQMKNVLQPNVLELKKIFEKHNHEIRIAGGAVRDLLMGKIPKDLDFATTATPTEMKTMFEKEQIRMLNKNGEKHGTITARINDEENFECTTLRIDKETDGRKAEVVFIKEWYLDAGRRDLTVNALYLGLDGTIYDYFDGISDIENDIVRFVGNPEERIKEDYVRILRYFRFYGVVAKEPDNHDEKVVKIIKENKMGLNNISGERIWMELSKIVTRRFGDKLLIKMIEIGLGPCIGLSDDFACDNVRSLFTRLNNNEIDISNLSAVTIIASGFHSTSEADHFIKRVKCSNKEKDIINYIITHKNKAHVLTFRDLQHLLADSIYKDKRSRVMALYSVQQFAYYSAKKELIDMVKEEYIPHYPIKGGMLLDLIPTAKKHKIGKEVHRLYEIWKLSEFTKTSEELLKEVEVK